MSHTTQTKVGSVVSLWQYPVKSMMGEELTPLSLRNVGCLGIVRMLSSTAPTGRWRRPRTRQNGRVSSISAPLSSSRRVPPRNSLQSELPPDGTTVTSDQGDLNQVLSKA